MDNSKENWINLIKIQEIPESIWDILIILDACRYDYFLYSNTIIGILEKRLSKNTCTDNWFKDNFKEPYPDILYISANPMVSKFKLGLMNKKDYIEIEEVWDYGWDNNINAVPAEPVTNATIRLIIKYPNKRFIVHYLQPHPPFINSPNTHIGRGQLWEYIESSKHTHVDLKEVQKMGGVIWNYINKKITVEEAREAYTKNLRYVLEEVKRLLKNIPKDKKVIITSDHGEMLGYPEEEGHFGHAPNLSYLSVKLVPWFEVNMDAV